MVKENTTVLASESGAGMTGRHHKGFFWSDRNVLRLDTDVGHTVSAFSVHPSVSWRSGHFTTVFKLRLNFLEKVVYTNLLALLRLISSYSLGIV